MDLHYCLEKYIDTKIKNGENVYLMDLNSWETDRTVFTQKIWKQFQSRLNSNPKYKINDGVGSLEKDHNNNYHIHIVFTYTKNYAKQTVYNLNAEIRRLWLSLNETYSNKKLHPKRFAVTPLDISAKNNLTRYLAKPIKHRKNKGAYLPKDFGIQSSFRVVLGNANDLWNKQELPSWKYSNGNLAKQLKTICNETKYKMSEIHLLENKGHNVLVTPMDIKNKLRTLLGGAEKNVNIG